MTNRAYPDLDALRRDRVEAMAAGRVRFTFHAEQDHRNIPRGVKMLVAATGEPIRRDERDHASPKFMCWANASGFGLLRAVFAMEDSPRGPVLVIISVFEEN
jgi:hypothetical protein